MRCRTMCRDATVGHRPQGGPAAHKTFFEGQLQRSQRARQRLHADVDPQPLTQFGQRGVGLLTHQFFQACTMRQPLRLGRVSRLSRSHSAALATTLLKSPNP